jgi:hypothetical protein
VTRGTGEPVQKEARACIRQDAVAIVPEPIEADGPATVVHSSLINVGSAAVKQRLLEEYRHNSAFNVTFGRAAVKPQNALINATSKPNEAKPARQRPLVTGDLRAVTQEALDRRDYQRRDLIWGNWRRHSCE